ISSSTHDYLVDPLAISDISSLGEIFASRTIQKVFHAAEYDIDCLKRDFSFAIANIFDTMIAGRTVGYRAVGLASMLEQAFGVKLDKRYQRANWGQRPLKQEMLEYARLDSHYLISLRQKLITQLRKHKRLVLAEEDCERLCTNSVPMPNHTADIWRIRGASDLKPMQLAALKSVHDFREELAKSNNKPPFKIMSNQALLEVAQTTPRYKEELSLLPSLSPHQVQRFGKGLIQAVKNAGKAPAVFKQHYCRPDDDVLNRREILSDWRKHTGETLGVQSDVVLPRDMMVQIADNNPASLQELSVVMADAPYRFEKFGKSIMMQLEGK
ncbi:MAG: HRDC domain-containing protein, partial [Anaerolineaceae bacterium]|nr:HRDC domain-containing protein [Anaerolineaceae bacterium]